jgi:putative ABC transport system substrate-binding protein
MDRRAFIVAGVTALAGPLAAQSEQAGKIRRIGWLNPSSASAAADYRKAFLEGLRDLGWIEGRNVVVEARHAEGKDDRLPSLAAELIRLKVDVILTSTTAIRVAQQATSTIPIVMAISINPVEQGLISSLPQPGGNITGLAWSPTPAISGKFLEFLKEVVPGLQRVGGIIDPSNRGIHAFRQATEDAASKLGLTLQHAEVQIPNDFEAAFATIAGNHAQAVLVYGSPFIFGHLRQIVELAAKHKLPATYPVNRPRLNDSVMICRDYGEPCNGGVKRRLNSNSNTFGS